MFRISKFLLRYYPWSVQDNSKWKKSKVRLSLYTPFVKLKQLMVTWNKSQVTLDYYRSIMHYIMSKRILLMILYISDQ